MTIEQAIERYLYEDVSHRSRSSQDTNRRWLRFFLEFCRREKAQQLSDISPDLVRRYQLRLHWEPGTLGRLYSANTVDLALRVMRRLLAWATARELILVDPAEDLVMPRVPRKLYRVLTVSEVQALLAAPSPDTAVGIRDRAFLELLYGTGLRRAEAIYLDLEDVDLAGGVLNVRVAKGHSQRQLPIGRTLQKALELYLETARPELVRTPDQGALLVTQRGTRPSFGWMTKTIEKYAERAGIDFRIGPHSLRHAFATHLMEGGADLRELQVFLGHRRLFSTTIYAHMCPSELVAEYRRTHPRADRHPEP